MGKVAGPVMPVEPLGGALRRETLLLNDETASAVHDLARKLEEEEREELAARCAAAGLEPTEDLPLLAALASAVDAAAPKAAGVPPAKCSTASATVAAAAAAAAVCLADIDAALEAEEAELSDDEACAADGGKPLCAAAADDALAEEARMREVVEAVDGPERVLIFDWDDTLLPSSWLAASGLRLDTPAELPEEAVDALAVLEDVVIRLLTAAHAVGRVVIITNAESGWVELSAHRFFPSLARMLSSIPVISARSTFEGEYPDAPTEWKAAAFQHEIAVLSPRPGGALTQVISMGDSTHEREALATVGIAHPHIATKSVKFVERPTVDQLSRQLLLMSSCLQDICAHDGNLDLMLTLQDGW
eukprot:PLAT2457.2.p2 GENE.PLAT2457.2~~PLAT2457.2.p2  ORF type:complete len:361 (-),score=179.70 PLAT2457.2:120-1202(-)